MTPPNLASSAVHDPHAEEMKKLIDHRRDIIDKITRLCDAGLPTHVGASLLRVASAADVTWVMRTAGVHQAVAAQLDHDLEA